MAFNPINRGTDEPLLQSQEYQFDWRRGGTYSEAWKGINPAKMITKWNGKVYTVSQASMRIGGGTAEAKFEWSGNTASGGDGGTSSIELTIDRWEVPQPKTEKPLISHPLIYDIFYALNVASVDPTNVDGNIAALCAKFQEGVAGNHPAKNYSDASGTNTIPGWFNNSNFPGIVGGISNDALHFLYRQYNRCLNGQTHYQDQTYSVVHTTNSPSYWSANISDSNVNCTYSLSRLIAELTDTGLWNFPLPGRLNYKITAAHNAFNSSLSTTAKARAGYMVGWLKSPSGEASVGRSRNEIQGGFVLDLWPTDLYPPIT